TRGEPVSNCVRENSAGRERGGGCRRHGIRGPLQGSRGDVISDDPCRWQALGGRAWPSVGGAHTGARVRGLRFWCYTRGLLLRSHAHCARGEAFQGGSAVVWGGTGSAARRYCRGSAGCNGGRGRGGW